MKKLITISFLVFFSLILNCLNESNLSVNNNTVSEYKTFALVNGLLIDGNGAEPVEDAVLVVRDGIIESVGKKGKTIIPAEAKVFDLQGAVMLPGFINAHVHSGYNPNNLTAWAREGVTTVRDLGTNIQYHSFFQRNELRKNNEYAMLVSAGPMMTVPNGYPKIPFGSTSGMPVESPEDAYYKAKKLITEGADILKIAIESGINFRRDIPTLSINEAKEIVRAAHEKGTRVSAHVLVWQDLEKALDAGADDIAHMVVNELPGRLISRMIEENVYWVPTLELYHGAGYGQDKRAIDNLRRYAAEGGKVAMGTDYDGYYFEFELGMPLIEIKLMHEAGMTPMQIIVASTKNAAYVCNMEDRIGTLEKGKIADILVVKNNPLIYLGGLKNIKMVVHNGRIIRDEG